MWPTCSMPSTRPLALVPVPSAPMSHRPADERQIEGGERVLIPALCGNVRQRVLLAEDAHVSAALVLQCRVAAPPRGAILQDHADRVLVALARTAQVAVADVDHERAVADGGQDRFSVRIDLLDDSVGRVSASGELGVAALEERQTTGVPARGFDQVIVAVIAAHHVDAVALQGSVLVEANGEPEVGLAISSERGYPPAARHSSIGAPVVDCQTGIRGGRLPARLGFDAGSHGVLSRKTIKSDERVPLTVDSGNLVENRRAHEIVLLEHAEADTESSDILASV